MKIFNKVSDFNKYSEDKGRIGFVPTMGALHEGHLALVQKAREENDIVVSSIFVNPVQFNNPNDLKHYPRDTENDIKKLNDAGCDILFMPSVEEMYPEEINKQFELGTLDSILEGKFRPGHFQGVALVVHRLFDIVKPDRAYFGEKDFQQLQVIKTMVKNENLKIEIIPCPTIREKDGLAMSSRNRRLAPKERAASAWLYHCLELIKSKAVHGASVSTLKETFSKELDKEPMFSLEYFEVAAEENLQSLEKIDSQKPAVALVAAYLGEVRLIDNIRIIS